MKTLALQSNRAMNSTVINTSIAPAVNPAQDISANLLDDFFAFLDVTPKTTATYQRALRRLFKYFTDNGITRPVYDDVLNYKRALEGAGRKPATIALYLAAARRFFAWTEQRGIYPNIAAGVKAPKAERGHKRDFLGAEQLTGIFSRMRHDTLQQRRDYAVMLLMSTCGLRTVEISRANIEDMRTLGGVSVLYVQGKGRKDRTEFVKLPAPVQKAITEYLSLRGNVADTAPLFASCSQRNRNGRMTTRSISRIAKTTMRSAGYNSSRLTAHSLRHSAVTLALLNGADLQDVQAFARHSNIATTTIYSHTVDRIRSTCEDTIYRAIFGRME
ncbi:MAG: tyrosine-type recombinase/integrase [Ruminococcus sp.]|nr:tyrosine-type recombinase/integrase [Ruminococcus sp.]